MDTIVIVNHSSVADAEISNIIPALQAQVSEDFAPIWGVDATIEFVAKRVGDWMLHCHLPHHMMNQMVSMVGPVHQHGGADHYPKDDPEKKKVPGYPQDMWMPMDDMVADKPEVYGLRPNWTGAMMGMMTMVRVLPPDLYDKIMDMKKNRALER